MNIFEQFWRQLRQEGRIEELEAKIENLLTFVNDLTTKVKAQGDLLYNADKNQLELAEKKAELEARLLDANDLIASKDAAIDSLKTELALKGEISAPVPDYLDTTKGSYTPYVSVEGEDVYLIPDEPYDLDIQLKKWVKDNAIRTLPKNQKIMKIWEFAVKAISYKYDKTDNWQPAAFSLHRYKGDCEDGVIIFISLCKLCGLRPDEAWNAVGPTDFGYHSYPIVKFDKDDKLGTDGESWYICESTLDYLPEKPMKLKGSKYRIDTGGLANWRYFGRIKPEFASQFNGAVSAAGGEERRIDLSEKKRKEIINHWKQVN